MYCGTFCNTKPDSLELEFMRADARARDIIIEAMHEVWPDGQEEPPDSLTVSVWNTLFDAVVYLEDKGHKQ